MKRYPLLIDKAAKRRDMVQTLLPVPLPANDDWNDRVAAWVRH